MGALLGMMVASIWLVGAEARADPGGRQAQLLEAAKRLLDEAQISYVYGGYQVGDSASCEQCNVCLGQHQPASSERLKRCPVCSACSLDCSHFTELVFRKAGVPYPYLETASMLAMSAANLRRHYHLLDLGTTLNAAAAGDLLVYNGHVVLLERLHPPLPGQTTIRGDVVHATGGRAIRRPGEGIQRERFVDLRHFRGELKRILRHEALGSVAPSESPPRALLQRPPLLKKAARLRPVAKRQVD